MKVLLNLVASGAAIMALSACGGGSSSSNTVTGVFQDANVAGLNYRCSSGKKDVTNSNGEFTCNIGDSVVFSLGGYVLGSATATSGIVTPMTLYPDNIEASTNILQLLQTLDDGTDGTITIPDNFSDLDDVDVSPTDSNFDDIIADELGKPLVPEDEAQAHMLNTLLAGKTLYTTIWDDVGTMESWSFNSDMTEVKWVEMVGGDANGKLSIDSIDGLTMTLSCTYDSETECEDEATVMEIKKTLADYLVVEVSGGELGSEVETLRVYFDEAKARDYLVKTEALLGTWYIDDEDGKVALTFFADGSYILAESGEEDEDGQSGMERGTYSYNVTTEAFTAEAQVDTNGQWGLSHPDAPMKIKVDNDTLTLTEGDDEYQATRVKNEDDSIVGSWYISDSSGEDSLAVITFLADNTYMMAEDGTPDDGGDDGMELGAYEWNSATNAFEVKSIDIDTNGDWGLSDIGSEVTIEIQGDKMVFTEGEDSMEFAKVP